MFSRRRFLQTTAGFSAALAAGRALPGVAAGASKLPIGLQLYAVRGEFTKDVPGTLKTVSQLGYQGVEFWGYGGTPNVFGEYSARQLRTILDQCGLKCCGIHLQVKALEAPQLATTIENNQILGNSLLNVAAAKDRMGSEEAIRKFAEFLNDAAANVAAAQMRVGYHAHGFDFAQIGGRTAWEVLFSHTRPEVQMQIDVGNCLGGGGDPVAMLKQFPGRTASIHLREHGDKTFENPWYQEIFRLCESTAKTQWYIVEMGGDKGLGFDVSRDALARLKKLGK